MTRFADRRRDGFTLMEIMIVLAILVIMGSIAVGLFINVQERAYRNSAKVQVDAIDQAAERYRAVVGEYPSVLDDLITQPANISFNKWAGPHIQDIPTDPWGNQYEYAYPGTNNAHLGKPDVWSWGPDRQSGTEDDIGNWPMVE